MLSQEGVHGLSPANFGKRAKAYQTGDTALLDEQGELHFMGRRDKQVNVRSQRVELADIEHNLVDSVPGITSAAVIIGMSSPPKTVAFVKSRLRKSTREDIAAHFTSYQPSLAADARLRDWLPAYMMPKTWSAVDKLLLTTSGKMDEEKLQLWTNAFHGQDKIMSQ